MDLRRRSEPGDDSVDPGNGSAFFRSFRAINAFETLGPEAPAFPCLIQTKALPSSPPSRARPCSKTGIYGFEPQNL
jgi:hypothetical protein